MSLRPLGKRILARADASEEKVGSFYVPDANKEKPTTGEVIAVGEGVDEISRGDRIVFGKYSATELKVDGETLLLLEVENVYAKLV